uniref:Anti-proliferative protein domain-containing protein n=1 Tax=Arcella intermedia TaxID=1963864 RepID=A0A6B2LNB2_9EUKA
MICDRGDILPIKAERFFSVLVSLMSSRFHNHWYPEDPLRGHAYRSISFDTMNEIDSLLLKAAQVADIKSLRVSMHPDIEHVVMWINPGEVIVKRFYTSRPTSEDIIFSRIYDMYQNQPYQNQPYPNQPYPSQPYQNAPYQNQPYYPKAIYW